MTKQIFLLIFTLLTFVSCEKELPEGTWSKDPSTTETYQLSLNKTTIVAKADGSSETFSITSDDGWTVNASDAWIKVSDTSGAGDKTITVTVEANTGMEARTGTITVKGKSSGTKSISVSQSRMDYALSVNKEEFKVGESAASVTLTITSDDDWTISTSDTWVTVSDTLGSGNKALTVNISQNSTISERIVRITVKGLNSNIEKTIAIIQIKTNGHEYVDLGLPSGLLWATCNVGASKPEDYGDYFAWGATKPQTVYDWVNTPYQTQNAKDYREQKFTKYLGSTTSLFKDSSAKDSDALKTVLDPEDDAAHVNWGGSWRMPTREELEELIDSNNCNWTWTTQNGVKGYKVTSLKNYKSLFLPAPGYRFSILCLEGTDGLYWSSSLFMSSYPDYAYNLGFNWGNVVCGSTFRSEGLSVRPVFCVSLE